jgi:uncharacterized membrane protein (DUF4010 family)
VVLLFSWLSFLGYLARKAAGPERGYALTGMLGGLVSSTAVAIGFSRRSRSEPALGDAFAGGVVGACVILLPRVLVVTTVLNPAVALALLPLLGPALVVGALALALIWRRRPREVASAASARSAPANPLQLWTAVRMTLAFQVALSLIAIVRTHVDSTGIYATGAALGLTDVDALTFAMSRAGGDITADVAARAIAIGIIANTGLKIVACAVLGRARFRRLATSGLAVLALGSVLGLVFW